MSLTSMIRIELLVFMDERRSHAKNLTLQRLQNVTVAIFKDLSIVVDLYDFAYSDPDMTLNNCGVFPLKYMHN